QGEEIERRKQHTDPRPKSKGPSQHLEEQPQITRVADDAVDAARGQHVPRLDRDQPAEPMAEHENRPNAQRATREEENNAQPADGVPMEGPDSLAAGESR